MFKTREKLVDDLMERYVNWRERAVAVSAAYDAWAVAAVFDRAAAFTAFQLSLDLEQVAADEYADYVAYVADGR